jgi:NAD(P)-dependent dehydrogenase (short-subunit alcohol dehydrogenase family)
MTNQQVPVVLVTGAGRGLGRGIALRLAELGMSVAINDIGNSGGAEETVRLCLERKKDAGQGFVPVQGDIGKNTDRTQILETTLASLGRIDALVNNAGIGPKVRADITGTTEESFDEVMRVNLKGPFFLTQLVVDYWRTKKPSPLLPHGFSVIFNTSISVTFASLNRVEYCISKAGLAMAGQAWALRLAGEGIQVYELRPGLMLTDMTRGVKEKYDRMIEEGEVPQRRWGTPEDVGKAVGALLQGEFPYSTGSVIYLDGGLHLTNL